MGSLYRRMMGFQDGLRRRINGDVSVQQYGVARFPHASAAGVHLFFRLAERPLD